MKSLQTSEGKNFRAVSRFGCLIAIIALCACSVSTKHDQDAGDPSVRPDNASAADSSAGSGDISLKDDHKSIEELRKNIAPEKRKENDELKAIMTYFGEVKELPQRIRDRFQRLMQRDRERFKRESERSRDEFNRDEKKRRDDFNAKVKKARDDFDSKKAGRDDKKRFFDDLEQQRRDFSADERTRRDDFNRDLKQKYDDFNAQARDREQEFNEQYRAYTTRFNDVQKELKRKHEQREHPAQAPSAAEPKGNSLFQNDNGGQ